MRNDRLNSSLPPPGGAASEPVESVQSVFGQLAIAIWRSGSRAALALALLVISKLAFVGVPMLLKRIVDHFDHAELATVLPVFLLIGYALLRFAGGLFTELRDLVFAPVTERIVADYSLRAFDHLHRLGARFHVRRQTGGVVRDVERGTAGIGFLVGVGLMTILPTLVEIASVLVILSVAYPGAFIGIIVATVAAYAITTRLLTERRAVLQRERLELDATTNARIVDSLLNYETVKAFAQEAFESRRLASVLDARRRIALRTQQALSTLHVSQSGVIALGVGAVMLLAGQRVAAGTLTVGDLVLINSYIIQVCLPLNSLGFVFRQSKDALLDVERLFALLRQQPEVVEGPQLPELRIAQASVRFDNVSFGYDAARQVLHGVDFTIPPGGTVAVVGGSGSGKSTIARLLLRLYDPISGRILVDEQDIRHVRQASLRRAIGLVPQDTALFNDSIAYNIAYGSTYGRSEPLSGADASARVSEAARLARVDEFIETLPERYETTVGERGLKLSGGEKQRIAIARAILKNPPILIFDEATSALDTRSERLIQQELERISQDRTTLIIAHRLSTVVNADRIVVLDRGRIVEQGTHDELLQHRGLYSQMWALQQAQGEIERTEQALSAQPINLLVLLSGVIEALRERMDRRGVTLYASLAESSAHITGDPSALQRLFYDLCCHLADTSPRGGRVELTMERVGADTRVMLEGRRSADAPIAAAPGNPKLVDPLQARSIVEAHKGHVEFDTSEAEVLRISLSFPLRAISESAGPAGSTETVAIDGLRIAAVDDQDDAREAMSILLSMQGAQVEQFDTGHGLIEKLRYAERAEWPDLLICDIALGEESGYEVLRSLRSLEDERDVALDQRLPAIALTGYAGSEHRTRALMAGFQMHLAKPVAADELLAAIGSLARRPAERNPAA